MTQSEVKYSVAFKSVAHICQNLTIIFLFLCLCTLLYLKKVQK